MSVKELLESLRADQPRLENLYRDFHAHPELSMAETRTGAVIAGELESYGYHVHRIGGGVVGVLRNGEGPCVLTRADMDGLPVAEQTGLPYASTEVAASQDGQVPVAHACGHDMHMACSLGAAKALADHRQGWAGTYVALFQPGEETAAGARAMVEAGLTHTVPRPDVAFAQHVLTSPAAGQVSVAAGPVLSTAANVEITVHGTGSHGSMPHLGVDPVVIMAAIVLRLQTLISRETAPGDFGVVTVGAVHAGQRANIISPTATLQVNIRAYCDTTRDQLIDGVRRIATAEAHASRAPRDPDFRVYSVFPLTDNDATATGRVRRAFTDHFGADNVAQMPPQTGSEDFSLIPAAWGTPYVYWGLGGYTPGRTPVANHHPGFAPDIQPTLRTGSEALLVAALDHLRAPGRPAE